MSHYSLDKESCIACGLCQTKAPQHIDYDDEGIVCFIDNITSLVTNDSEMEEAFRQCPVHAIIKHN